MFKIHHIIFHDAYKRNIKENNIKIEYISTNMQIADVFIKALHKTKFLELLFLCYLYK